MVRGKLSTKEAVLVSKPLRWVVTFVLFLAGSILTIDTVSLTLVVGVFYFLFPYNLLIYGVNDIFDYESDIRNDRKSANAPAKIISKLKHPALKKLIFISNLPFILFLLAAGNLESNVFLVMMIYMALAYSASGLRYKEIPLVDSLTSAFQITSPFLFGLFLFESPMLWASIFAGLYFWAVGNHAFAALQDIAADKKAKIKTIATTLGTGKTILIVLFSYILAALAPVLEYGLMGLWAALALAPYFFIVLSTYAHRSGDSAMIFRNAWRKLQLINCIVGLIGTLLLFNLYNK